MKNKTNFKGALIMPTLEPYGKNCYRIPRQGMMKADVLVYLNQSLYRDFKEEQPLQQLVDAASLDGVSAR
jgi:hypothetical protein